MQGFFRGETLLDKTGSEFFLLQLSLMRDFLMSTDDVADFVMKLRLNTVENIHGDLLKGELRLAADVIII